MKPARFPSKLLLLAALWFRAASIFAQPAESDPAFARAQQLRHGINASIWFAQHSGRYTVDYLRTFTTADDIALIARLGFDHVRLSIDPDPLTEWRQGQTEGAAFVTELDRVVKTIVDSRLAVILDIHPESKYKAPLRQGTQPVQQFASLWRALAAHYASTDPNHVYFEIMNEPEQDDPYRWQGIESTVAAAIREVAPQHTIILAGAHWSGLEDLLVLQPVALKNVIYTFHDYEPFPFTHQGATWTTPDVQPLRAIPYPSSPEAVTPKLDEESSLSSQFFLNQYGLGRWDAFRVENTIEFAAKWGKLHNVPVYCGEFGVLRDYAPTEMRAQWLHDMRVAFERNDIGWAMWDYQTNFGIVTKKDGVTMPDDAIVKALGLSGTTR
jgi:endoglucanase